MAVDGLKPSSALALNDFLAYKMWVLLASTYFAEKSMKVSDQTGVYFKLSSAIINYPYTI